MCLRNVWMYLRELCGHVSLVVCMMSVLPAARGPQADPTLVMKVAALQPHRQSDANLVTAYKGYTSGCGRSV